ncbi:MAG: paraslipin, partial [Schleiferiaceae bacterium]
MPTLILFATLSLLVAVLLAKGIRIVKQSEAMIVERLGKYHRTLESGINVIIPVIDRPRQINWRYTETGFNGEIISIFKLQDRIDLRENVYDFPKQNVITRDNVVTEINALIYFQIVDPLKSVYEIGNLPNAIEKLTQTTLRNVVGEMDLDECLSSRDTINAKLRAILDDATNKWGVKVNRVELQD